jgi:ribonuclease P protein component
MYGATARNQLKRKMREAYRQRKHLLNDVLARNTSDVQLVFLFRDAPPKSVTEKKAIDASMAKLLEDVKKIIRRM